MIENLGDNALKSYIIASLYRSILPFCYFTLVFKILPDRYTVICRSLHRNVIQIVADWWVRMFAELSRVDLAVVYRLALITNEHVNRPSICSCGSLCEQMRVNGGCQITLRRLAEWTKWRTKTSQHQKTQTGQNHQIRISLQKSTERVLNNNIHDLSKSEYLQQPCENIENKKKMVNVSLPLQSVTEFD